MHKYLKCDVHEQRNAAEDEREGNIDIASDAVPKLAAALYAAGVYLIHKLAFFHHIKPRHSASVAPMGMIYIETRSIHGPHLEMGSMPMPKPRHRTHRRASGFGEKHIHSGGHYHFSPPYDNIRLHMR